MVDVDVKNYFDGRSNDLYLNLYHSRDLHSPFSVQALQLVGFPETRTVQFKDPSAPTHSNINQCDRRVFDSSCCPSVCKELNRESYEETIELELYNPCYLRLFLALPCSYHFDFTKNIEDQQVRLNDVACPPGLYGICAPPFTPYPCVTVTPVLLHRHFE